MEISFIFLRGSQVSPARPSERNSIRWSRWNGDSNSFNPFMTSGTCMSRWSWKG